MTRQVRLAINGAEVILSPMELRELRWMLIRVIGMDSPFGTAMFVNEHSLPIIMRIEEVMPFDKPETPT